jgi:hypothetical protein
MPIKDLKAKLRLARVCTKQVANISYVDQDIVEFLLVPSYFPSFRSLLRHADSLKILAGHDPAIPRDPKASQKIKDNIKQRFLDRLHKTAVSSTVPAVRQYFSDWSTSLGAPVPTGQAGMSYGPTPEPLPSPSGGSAAAGPAGSPAPAESPPGNDPNTQQDTNMADSNTNAIWQANTWETQDTDASLEYPASVTDTNMDSNV